MDFTLSFDHLTETQAAAIFASLSGALQTSAIENGIINEAKAAEKVKKPRGKLQLKEEPKEVPIEEPEEENDIFEDYNGDVVTHEILKTKAMKLVQADAGNKKKIVDALKKFEVSKIQNLPDKLLVAFDSELNALKK